MLVDYLGRVDPALNTGPMVQRRKAVASSLTDGIAKTQPKLDSWGQHGIAPNVEMIPIKQINEANERMLRIDAKYRFVIDVAPLKAIA